jgi:hypothetical protein
VNTTTLTNGVHSIFWLATASNGQQDGIGSRFFSVANSSLGAGVHGSDLAARDADHIGRVESPALMLPERGEWPHALVADVNAVPIERRAIVGRRGFDLSAPLQSFAVTAEGRATIDGEELDRIELHLGGPGYTGYTRAGDALGPLPIGSTIDPATGVFTWGVGVGFVHAYDLVFVRWAQGQAAGRQEVRIALGPQHSNLVGPQVVIDVPAPNATVSGAFLLGGWAVDLDDPVSTGAETLHAWAYPVSGGDPIFLGATAYGGERPDVAAIFGARFKDSGYNLIVDALPAGAYDIAVFAWSSVRQAFAPARIVRIIVK